MASVRKTGKGKWKVQWRQGGRGTPQHSKTFSNEKEAQIEAAKIRLRKLQGEKPTGSPNTDTPDLKEMHAEYLRRVAPIYSRNTIRNMARSLDQWEGWLTDIHGDKLPPTLLSRRTLEDYRDHLSSTGLYSKKRSPQTVVVMMGDVQRFWAWAWDDEVYEDFVPKPRKLLLRRPPEEIVKAPSWSEMDAVIHAAKPPRQSLATMLRFTGLRVNQVMHLLWADIDLNNSVLTVRGELGKSRAEKAGRIIPVSAYLVEYLKTLERVSEFIIPFSDRRGSRQANATAMKRLWETTGAPKLVYDKRPHHAFRKGWVSGLARLGADIEAVEKMVGHRIAYKTTSSRGNYLDPDFLPLREAIELIPPIEPATP